MSLREKFEAAVIERMKKSGFLEVQIRVECLVRDGEGYYDGSIDAYWAFFQVGAASVVVDLPDDGIDDCRNAWGENCKDTFDCGYNFSSQRHEQAIAAAGGTVKS